MNSKKLGTVVVGITAMIGTIAGIVIAATGSPPNTPTDLHGTIPTSAVLNISMKNADGTRFSGVASIDFVHNRIDAYLDVPVIIAKVRVEVREVHGVVYAGLPTLSGKATWMKLTSTTTPDLTGLAAEMAHPEFDLLANSGSVQLLSTKSVGDTTVRTYASSLGKGAISGLASSMTLRITTGRQGQVLALALSSGSRAGVTVTMTVRSYNAPVSIDAPKPSEIGKLDTSIFNSLLGGSQIPQILCSSASGLGAGGLGATTQAVCGA